MAIKINFSSPYKITASENGKLVGYLTVCHPADASRKRNLEIKYIYVKPSYRRRGIGTKLLQSMFNRYKNITWISLWTGKEAEITKNFLTHKKLGFKEMAYQADYYEKGIGTRFMAKRMS